MHKNEDDAPVIASTPNAQTLASNANANANATPFDGSSIDLVHLFLEARFRTTSTGEPKQCPNEGNKPARQRSLDVLAPSVEC
ncbi:hypothetical protein Hypma_004911 [Hypsizygus marmoreus]|uniref:Uncharacterized protein n=1 Tax=Hypsizygus marmoreus TaxID=39966 RepID=A0A369KGJ8_HYPMA|nr:hypothetical protein Hypma_004911 [Hypsizygus marmoreus]